MTRAEWTDHLLNATGPLAIERIDELQADAELRELLRELVTLPWDESRYPEHPAGSNIPYIATCALGFARDTGSVDLLFDALEDAFARDWARVIELLIPAIAALGPEAAEEVIARIERIEADPKLDPLPPHYEWHLISILSLLALEHSEVASMFVRMASERISDRAFDPGADAGTIERFKADRAEIWLMEMPASLQDDLQSVIDEFFERCGPDYRSELFGDREEFIQDLSERPTETAREQLLGKYEEIRADVYEDARLWEITAEEWIVHLVNGTGPLAPDRVEYLTPPPLLLEMLRGILASEWSELDRSRADVGVIPLYAALLLGIFKDRAAAPLLIIALHRAWIELWVVMTHTLPMAIGLTGENALPFLREEIELIEQDPENDPAPPFYEVDLVRSLCWLASSNEAARSTFIEMAAERIADRSHDRVDRAGSLDPVQLERMKVLNPPLDRGELWVGASIDMDAEELKPALDDFFTRRGANYSSFAFGDSESYWERAEVREISDARGYLVDIYRQSRESFDPAKLLPLRPYSLPSGLLGIDPSNARSEWYEHLMNTSGPLAVENVGHLQSDPELLALLRDAIRIPWPDSDEEADMAPAGEIDMPVDAAILLGLLGDTESAPAMIAALRQSIVEDWDWLTRVLVPAIAALGPVALPLLLEEIEHVEREPGYDPRTPHYEYVLVSTLAHLAGVDPDARQVFVTMAHERIADPTATPKYHRTRINLADPARMAILLQTPPDRMETWVAPTRDIAFPELEPVVDAFFERRGPGYLCSMFGGREHFYKARREAEPQDLRARLQELYREFHDPDSVEEPLEPERERRGSFGNAPDRREPPYAPRVRTDPKVGRNDPCPCGSGKKYKKCCGA